MLVPQENQQPTSTKNQPISIKRFVTSEEYSSIAASLSEILGLICSACHVKCKTIKLVPFVNYNDYVELFQYLPKLLVEVKEKKEKLDSLSEDFIHSSPSLNKINEFFTLRKSLLFTLKNIINSTGASGLVSIDHEREFYNSCNIAQMHNIEDYIQIFTENFNNFKQLNLINTQHDVYLPRLYGDLYNSCYIGESFNCSSIINNMKFFFNELALIDTKYSQLYKIAKENNDYNEIKEINKSSFDIMYDTSKLCDINVCFNYEKDQRLLGTMLIFLASFVVSGFFTAIYWKEFGKGVFDKNVLYGSAGLSMSLILLLIGLSICYCIGRKGHNKSFKNMTDYLDGITTNESDKFSSEDEEKNCRPHLDDSLNDDTVLSSKVTEVNEVEKARVTVRE
ncbi:hypothetical protein HL033_04490 [Neoehrlichia mikurensis]|uniref:Uncharacterized protein n=1 Tax=Neoehrlichia mikurensis TaxID=89586 RepID=A0A9Q9F3Q7_9RICK|nr:hypothetical protein [Neoehrlichia mikurensis]QXK91969.1 hypothetical protein IAH97_04490 [Neoehrlichia mikurensis]QXK93183.1 hypothetical protein HUN61_04485 [Neoehrlichia mikurensis]QXK93661.1 hypothetical protein HL033_04490 [Neoehrlichia mikurensis]UTO55382.1 hypothetical protein LUA82_04360 [Neoehrlichia mikurensis]UTO56301.1 hypothetical protein LUA81_04310 [Neoehrlichia mikurensis]